MLPNMFKIAGELTPAVHPRRRAHARDPRALDLRRPLRRDGRPHDRLRDARVRRRCRRRRISRSSPTRPRSSRASRSSTSSTASAPRTRSTRSSGSTDDDLARADRRRARQRAPATARCRPTTRSSAARRRTPTSSSRRARPQPVLRRACPAIVAATRWTRFAARTGRRYRLFDYVGAPDAERVIVLMGSGAERRRSEAVEALVAARRAASALVKVRLYRPFAADALRRRAARDGARDRRARPHEGARARPASRSTRTSSPRSPRRDGRARCRACIGGRYGLASKEFTPAMVKAVFDELAAPEPRRHFTVGIVDDVTAPEPPAVDRSFTTEADDVVRAVFYGLGSDGTVGANKNSIKIIGEHDGRLRPGLLRLRLEEVGLDHRLAPALRPAPIRSTYLIDAPTSSRCHQFGLLERDRRARRRADGRDVPAQQPVRRRRGLGAPARGGAAADRRRSDCGSSWSTRPRSRARRAWAGAINTVLQTCFFALSGVLPRDEAIAAIKDAIEKTYGKRGAGGRRRGTSPPSTARSRPARGRRPRARSRARTAARRACRRRARLRPARHRRDARRRGDDAARERAPGRRHVPDRHRPLREARDRRRDPDLGSGDLHRLRQLRARLPARGDPHEGLRRRRALDGAPDGFQTKDWRASELPGMMMTIQVAPDDCTGCGVCVDVCPAHAQGGGRAQVRSTWSRSASTSSASARDFDFFLAIPEIDRTLVDPATVKGSQLLRAAVRVLGRLRGLRRDAVPQAAHPALRRPHARRQRHRLLVDLRRQPADHAVDGEPRRARPGVVQLALRGQRRVRPRHAARARRAGAAQARAARRASCAPDLGERARRGGSVDARRASPSSARARRRELLRPARRRIDGPEARRLADARRRPRPQERLDRRRRRLGLRHRLRRARPRARLGPRRERPRARHRGLLEHRRPGVEVDAARRGRQVRRGRQAERQEGPRADRHHLRQRLRRAGRDRRRQPADRRRRSPRPRR